MKDINILGLNIAKIKKNELFLVLDNYILGNKAKHIVTANPEILLHASRDEEYFSALSASDLILPDGIGLKFAALAMFDNLYRFTGVELVKYLLDKANNRKLKIAVLNWRDGLVKDKELKHYLEKKFNNIQALVVDIEKNKKDIPLEIIRFAPDILFTALGYGRQEKIIFYNKKKIPNLKIAVGVGGTFDFLTGKIKRAPGVIRILGLEWIYRIFAQSSGRKLWRLKRIFDAVFVFVWKFLSWRFILPFLYRPNVACLLYKKSSDNIDILIVERADVPGHWQLPQGGLDGLDIKIAAKKELSEELNTNNFKIRKIYPFLYKYNFKDEGLGKYKKSKGKHYGYRGQKQALAIVEFIGNDVDIKINAYEHLAWKWVNINNLSASVHPLRKKAAIIYLAKFNQFISV